MSERNFITWCIPVPKALDRDVENAVKNGLFISKSDLVRTACRRTLDVKGQGGP